MLDLDAIRRKVAQLSGQRQNNSDIQFWKPEVGEYRVRLLPNKWIDDPSNPLLERFFYYWARPGILAPHQFGKPDPVQDLIRKLYNDKTEGSKELAKKLRAKLRAFAMIVVRGQEDKVLVWSLNPFDYKRILSFFIDEDYGNIMDPQEGFDLKVVFAPDASGKKWNGKPVINATIDVKGKPCPLHTDPAVVQKLLDSVPNIDNMYKLKSAEEVEAALNAYINSDQPESEQIASGETTRGAETKDPLDEIVNEVKAEKKAAAPAQKKKEEPKAESEKKSSLDEAFDDLMNDEDE